MIDSVALRPLVVHEITRMRSIGRCPLDGFELRTVGLAAAGYLLHVPVADGESADPRPDGHRLLCAS